MKRRRSRPAIAVVTVRTVAFESFIADFNAIGVEPFGWMMKGKPLVA